VSKQAIDRQILYRPEPPWVLIDVLSLEEQRLIPSFLYQQEGINSVTRMLRGRKMQTVAGLMSEFGAALQFFEGFGENWYALEECLSYLDEWLEAEAYILALNRPDTILADESIDQLGWFITTLNEVGEWWQKPITDNGRFNRGPVPFHVVIQTGEEGLEGVQERFGEVPFLTSSGA